jgi:MSHA pilin protein MshD
MAGSIPDRRPNQAGYTLIELVVAIIILAIAVSGAMAALSDIAVRSANAMVQEQATAIAPLTAMARMMRGSDNTPSP